MSSRAPLKNLDSNNILTNAAIENDPELDRVVKQLRSHLGSMQGNVASLRGVRRMVGGVERDLRRAKR